MKKRFFSIIIVLAMVVSLVACGKTQAQPETTTTPAPKVEEPKEEPAQPVVEETKEEPETVAVENPYVIDGVDYTAYYNGEFLTTIIEEKVEYDTLKVYIINEGQIYGIMSDGDTVEIEEKHDPYIFIYYSPKPVVKIETIGETSTFVESNKDYKKTIGQGYYYPGEKGNKVGIKVTYEDGTEDSIVINFEATNASEESSNDVEEPSEAEMYDTDGIDFTSFDNGGDIFSLVDSQMKYDTLKVIVMNSDCKDKAVLSDGGFYKLRGEDGQYCMYYFYSPKEVSSVEEIGEFNTFHDMREQNPKLVAIGTSMKSGEKLPIGIKVTYSDGTEDSITIYVTQ